MEIIERAKGDSGEIISWNESEANVREEINKRTYRAGYTNREGGPTSSGKIWSAGGIGSNEVKLWPRDENGNLIDD